ncbi:hypothetical protein WDV85_11300 [Pseudokineococcus sp. 5B2Z-1]
MIHRHVRRPRRRPDRTDSSTSGRRPHGPRTTAATCPRRPTAEALTRKEDRVHFGTKTRSEKAAKQLRDQTAALKDRVGPAADSARKSATQYAGAARDWATPHYERARDRSLEVTAPRVAAAAGGLVPAVDAAHDKLVDDLLPRIVESLNAAAGAASDKVDEAYKPVKGSLKKQQKSLKKVEKKAKRNQRSGGVGKVLLVLGVLGAAGGAAYAAWRSSQPSQDPWAASTGGSAYSGAPGGATTTTSTSGSTSPADAGDTARSATASATASVKEAADKAADQAKSAADKSANSVKEGADKASGMAQQNIDKGQAKAEEKQGGSSS